MKQTAGMYKFLIQIFDAKSLSHFNIVYTLIFYIIYNILEYDDGVKCLKSAF